MKAPVFIKLVYYHILVKKYCWRVIVPAALLQSYNPDFHIRYGNLMQLCVNFAVFTYLIGLLIVSRYAICYRTSDLF